MKLAWGLATLVFLVALPVALLTGNVRWLANNQSFYEQGYAKYGSYQATGLPKSELDRATGEMIAYFNSNQDLPGIQVRAGDRNFPLFDQRDSVHLRDVRDLLQFTFRVQEVSLAYVVLFSVAFLFRGIPRRPAALAGVWMWGGVFSATLLLAIGMMLMFNFDQLFLQFHLLSFSNDFWVLDPSKSYLIRMVPAGFFFDMATWTAGLTLVESVVLATAAGIVIARQNRSSARL